MGSDGDWGCSTKLWINPAEIPWAERSLTQPFQTPWIVSDQENYSSFVNLQRTMVHWWVGLMVSTKVLSLPRDLFQHLFFFHVVIPPRAKNDSCCSRSPKAVSENLIWQSVSGSLELKSLLFVVTHSVSEVTSCPPVQCYLGTNHLLETFQEAKRNHVNKTLVRGVFQFFFFLPGKVCLVFLNVQ